MFSIKRVTSPEVHLQVHNRRTAYLGAGCVTVVGLVALRTFPLVGLVFASLGLAGLYAARKLTASAPTA